MAVRIAGFEDLRELIDGMRERVGSLDPLLQVYAQDARTMVDDAFAGSASPGGEAWEPLKPATIRKRRARSSKPLVDTGRLRNSIVAQGLGGVIKIGMNVAYAGVHQFGGAHIPARPFLPLTASGELMTSGASGEWTRRLKAAIVRYITTGVVE